MSLDIHPVFAHFPQAFTFTVLVLSGLCLILSGETRDFLLVTLKTLAVCLPFTVILTFAAGLFDGKIRLKRLHTPLLIKKIVIGGLFIAFSAGGAVLICATPMTTPFMCGFAVLSFCSFLCSIALGLLGVKLLTTRLPG
ncbi:MAG: hypothetical protein A2X49_13015 [Lentisphaerae bacterium GWF2_52_8]|nr:MAG: hypothetical protein A2X49_13015 [Lentisphaerae bacterium GWF2_52_8]